MIYTCYEMIRDCRADKPEGWSHLVVNYVPVLRKLVAQYHPERRPDEAVVKRVLQTLRSSRFLEIDPAPERPFLARLRMLVVEKREPELPLDLEILNAALESFTTVERQAAWLETMRYDAAATARMLNLSAETAAKIRSRTADLLRGKADSWSQSILEDNGPALERAAAESVGGECICAKDLLDIIDGSTWMRREQAERHVHLCWHCIGHFCRLREVCDVLKSSKPLSEEEAAPYRALLGIAVEKRPGWKRLFARR
ncbi:MAG: hypothetical protein WD696_03080 [Bryobacteraceae bacterium]